MIGCFPDPYPDELLYSVCARYKERMLYIKDADVFRNLFDCKCVVFHIDIPLRIKYLSEILPPGNRYSIERFLQDNTLYPFYRAFFGRDYLNNYEKLTRMDVYSNERLMLRDIQTPRFIRYCPLCVVEDNEKFGETYWHRLHQIVGVTICPLHHVFTQNSRSGINAPYKVGTFVTAKKALEPLKGDSSQVFAKVLGHLSPKDNLLLNISMDALWLLNQKESDVEPRKIFNCYTKLLRERGFTFNSKANLKFMKSNHFTNQLTLDGLYNLVLSRSFFHERTRSNGKYTESVQNRSTISVFLGKLQMHPARNYPLYHLLMIRYLGYTPKSFFSLLRSSDFSTIE